ncbi:hypothetical protein ACHAXT_006717 [Thalassiosira profunda]
MLGIKERHAEWLKAEVFGAPLFGLPPYPILVTGTLLVGMAQPFFQCTPPLLSEQWFASNERATSSAVALNFNQVGIAVAFIVAGSMFQNLPPVPPSASEMEKLQKGPNHEPPFHVSVRTFFSTPGFARPLAAFICSIAITNVVGAFIDEVMERGGVTDRRAIAWAGAGFEMAIVLGEWFWGRKEPVLLVISLFLLGFFVGPVQPINAELAVDVTYPGDETAVESVQQFGGNFCSALFVPVAGRAAKLDYDIFPNVNSVGQRYTGRRHLHDGAVDCDILVLPVIQRSVT